MNVLDFVPKWLLALLLAAVSALAGVQTARLAAARHTLEDLRESILKARELRQEQQEAQREIERARARVMTKAQDEAHEQLQQVHRDRQRLATVLERLRATAAVPADQGGRDPAVAESSAPAAGPGLVLADVFSRSGERLRSCAAALDESRIAGALCERAYDAVANLSTNEGASHGAR